jgi:hypothetical protein
VSIPFSTFVVLAGLQAIPADVYEAACVNDAGPVQTYRKVTLWVPKTVSPYATWAYSRSRPPGLSRHPPRRHQSRALPEKARGEWWAVHYEPGICRSHRLPAPMSDEHKRRTEYWAPRRAG